MDSPRTGWSSAKKQALKTIDRSSMKPKGGEKTDLTSLEPNEV